MVEENDSLEVDQLKLESSFGPIRGDCHEKGVTRFAYHARQQEALGESQAQRARTFEKVCTHVDDPISDGYLGTSYSSVLKPKMDNA